MDERHSIRERLALDWKLKSLGLTLNDIDSGKTVFPRKHRAVRVFVLIIAVGGDFKGRRAEIDR